MCVLCLRGTVAVVLTLLASWPAVGQEPSAAELRVRIGDRELPAVAVGGQLATLVEADWIDQDEAFRAAAGQVAEACPDVTAGVATWQDAAGGCDGVKTGGWGFHTASNETDPWWQVDLGRSYPLERIVVYNRTDGNTAPRTRQLQILAAEDPATPEFVELYRHQGEPFYGAREQRPLVVDLSGRGVRARVVRVAVSGCCSFALDEIEVYGRDQPEVNLALGKPADQKSVGAPSRAKPGARPWGLPVAATMGPQPFSLEHIEAVMGRGRQLLERFHRFGKTPPRLAALTEQWRQLENRHDELLRGEQVSEARRRELYFAVRRALRRIAFCHPLLDFDRLLFLKRQDPGGLYHMVHQFYGFGALPGGGLYVLCDPFSDEPKLVDLLQESVVQQGRLAGKRLAPGSFLSPDLSFDGRRILFAYTEARGEGVEWSPRASYHIFCAAADGSGLTQLTDGPWNEFDPCWLPNGRIAFVSERRGGYLRCGGSAPPYDSPTYTLHTMAADGNDVVCLSFHETQEWQPSVDHHGMLVYTRWDYVDRDTNVAHHIWSCYPDGRDPRSYHGNYPQRRESRPWMEMDIRAVPGSHKYVATAAAHHGHAYGSLVLIDYRPLDDGGMSQLERLTPDVPFPESEGGKALIRSRMAYGTAWPLGEDDFLCVYDRHAANRGIYWIDRFGNRELLYRDPEISCLSPIPLRPRPCPPAIPDRTGPVADSELPELANAAQGVVAVANVYDADFAWPEQTEITALRVIQVLPKTTPPVDQPRIGAATETNARAVLGTVPVEPDGSAYFVAPAGKQIYFQALDRRGLAVQSMRSGTYVHPGETLSCQGCHEPKHRPPARRGVPLALQRPPSALRPEADGSNPFNYPRLVQGVLDRHCVDCHRKRGALDLSGAPAAQHGWTRSYESLAAKYGFYFTVSNGSINRGVHGGSRTLAGRFGARAAPLLPYLEPSHYGVQLSGDEFRRITLWLDCNSEFYGAYHDIQAQARGEIVRPQLD